MVQCHHCVKRERARRQYDGQLDKTLGERISRKVPTRESRWSRITRWGVARGQLGPIRKGAKPLFAQKISTSFVFELPTNVSLFPARLVHTDGLRDTIVLIGGGRVWVASLKVEVTASPPRADTPFNARVNPAKESGGIRAGTVWDREVSSSRPKKLCVVATPR